MPSKDLEDKSPHPKRSVLEYSGVLEAFKQPPVQQDQPPGVQQDPPLEQPASSPEERWSDPDEFLASSDLYLAQAPFSSQKRKSSPSHTPTSPRPTEPQQPPNEPDDEEDIQDFVRLCDQKPWLPTARKPKSSLQNPGPGTASPPTQASVAATAWPESNSPSQQNPYKLRIPPARRIPKEKDPPDLDFREDHFG